MIIKHKIDEFLFTIFPELMGGGNDLIINKLKNYYTFKNFKPKVVIKDNWVTIEIDAQSIITQEKDYQKVISLCEKGNYAAAKPILTKLIEQNPTHSEYHRIMGQILSDEGDQEEAINCLIDALRWDSKNGWALLMMGNIFAKFKDDVSTAMKYYDQALVANAHDVISLTNIGFLLQKQGKLIEAKKYFYEALKINNEYPNTHFALGLIAEMENDLHSAFYSILQAIKLNKTKDVLYQNSVRQAVDVAKKITNSAVGKKIYSEYKCKLELEGNRPIDILQDEEIPTPAKIEFAENYDRTKHLVRFKSNYPCVEHLIMHELVHLDFVIKAQKENSNQLFVSTQQNKADFIKILAPTINKLQKMGVTEKAIEKYGNELFDGLNLQAYNTPIDLFIEDFLYNEYPELRPYQFLSLYNLIQEGLKAVTDKKIVEVSPAAIISKSKVYNMVNAIQFRELFGLDFIKDYQAILGELKLANDFYNEFLDYKDDKEPAEEYELVLHWAEDLKLDKNFELIDEVAYRNRINNPENILKEIEKDPFDVNSNDLQKKRDVENFQKSQQEIGTNMAVVMFMVDALQFFEGMSKEDIKKIAFDIAMQGTQGFSPDKDNYRINSIKNKTFSGYHMLAYYYVSWSLAMPDEVNKLGLEYEKEYEMAKQMNKKGTEL